MGRPIGPDIIELLFWCSSAMLSVGPEVRVRGERGWRGKYGKRLFDNEAWAVNQKHMWVGSITDGSQSPEFGGVRVRQQRRQQNNSKPVCRRREGGAPYVAP